MGSVAAIVYCTLFGIAFFVSSTLYLFTLDQLEAKGHCGDDDDPDPWTIPEKLSLTTPPPASEILGNFENKSINKMDHDDDCTAGLKEWKFFAKTGIIYGLVCFFLGIFHLWIVCWRACLANDLKEQPTILLQTVQKKGRNWRTVALSIATIHQRLLHKGLGRNVIQEYGFWHRCAKCFRGFYISMTYILLMAIWLTSILVPVYIAAGLGRTHALYVQKGQLYPIALALFVICLTSLSFVIVSACVIVCFQGYEGQFWNFVELDSSSGCVDEVPAAGQTVPFDGQEGRGKEKTDKSPGSTILFV